jgi:hypothetical protein
MAFAIGMAAIACRLAGCSGVTTVPHAGKPSGTLTLPLDGVYTATLHAPYVGPLQMRLAAKPDEAGFVASTRPGVAWDMIGGLLGFVGQFVAPFIFPDGVILTWRSPNPTTTQPAEGWMQLGGLKSAGVRTIMRGANDPIHLVTSDGREIGTLTLQSAAPQFPAASEGDATRAPNKHTKRSMASAAPLMDYPALAASAATVLRARLYDPDVADSSQVRAYLSQLRDNAKIARDDLEFIFGAVAAGRNHLSLSLPLLVKSPTPESEALLRDIRSEPDSDRSTLRVTFDDAKGVATMKIEAFLDAAEVDRAFDRLLAHTPAPRALVIDMWTCPGVSLSSFRALSWLIASPMDAGVLTTASQRPAVLSGNFQNLESIDVSSPASIAALEVALDSGASRRVNVSPDPHAFTGPVAIVCGKKTTTTAEPFVALLKKCERARLFGNTTAGRPLVSRPSNIGQGWEMWIPVAEWRDSGTKTLAPGRGVRPNIDLDKAQARAAAQAWCEEQISSPSSPAVSASPALGGQ